MMDFWGQSESYSAITFNILLQSQRRDCKESRAFIIFHFPNVISNIMIYHKKALLDN